MSSPAGPTPTTPRDAAGAPRCGRRRPGDPQPEAGPEDEQATALRPVRSPFHSRDTHDNLKTAETRGNTADDDQCDKDGHEDRTIVRLGTTARRAAAAVGERPRPYEGLAGRGCIGTWASRSWVTTADSGCRVRLVARLQPAPVESFGPYP